MVTRVKQASLVVCLFLFLFVVIGGGLHLNPGGAFLAAVTGTPLVIHLLNRIHRVSVLEHDRPSSPPSPGSPRCAIEGAANRPGDLENETLVRQ